MEFHLNYYINCKNLIICALRIPKLRTKFSKSNLGIISFFSFSVKNTQNRLILTFRSLKVSAIKKVKLNIKNYLNTIIIKLLFFKNQVQLIFILKITLIFLWRYYFEIVDRVQYILILFLIVVDKNNCLMLKQSDKINSVTIWFKPKNSMKLLKTWRKWINHTIGSKYWTISKCLFILNMHFIILLPSLVTLQFQKSRTWWYRQTQILKGLLKWFYGGYIQLFSIISKVSFQSAKEQKIHNW